jgi:hypothetical protein
MTIAAHYGNDEIVVFREVNNQGLSDDNTSTLDYWQFGEDGHIELCGQDKFAELAMRGNMKSIASGVVL